MKAIVSIIDQMRFLVYECISRFPVQDQLKLGVKRGYLRTPNVAIHGIDPSILGKNRTISVEVIGVALRMSNVWYPTWY